MESKAIFEGFKFGLTNLDDLVFVAKAIACHISPGIDKVHILAAYFLYAGYKILFHSWFDSIPVKCSVCDEPMRMRGFEKEMPGGLRPFSYKVIGQCLECGFIEEF